MALTVLCRIRGSSCQPRKPNAELNGKTMEKKDNKAESNAAGDGKRSVM